jgi:hypothetical protein
VAIGVIIAGTTLNIPWKALPTLARPSNRRQARRLDETGFAITLNFK